MAQGSTSVASTIPELTAHSGSAYLYFYSDAAVNMSGFSIRYRYMLIFGDIGDCCGWRIEHSFRRSAELQNAVLQVSNI